MSDPFRERIENLLRQGKISPEEANKLFRALEPQGETASASTPLTGSQPAPSIPTPVTPPKPPTPPTPPTPVAAVVPPTPPTPVTLPTPSSTAMPTSHSKGLDHYVHAANIRKLVINATAGDIDVEGISGLGNIEANVKNGSLEITEDGDVIRILGVGKIDDPTEIGWLNTVIRTIGRNLPVDIHVKVPSTLLELEVKALAGDVTVGGVTGSVTLEMSAGDLKLKDAGRFNINAKAGDIKVRTKLTDGESNLRALAGNVDVILEGGSSVTMKASNSAGDITAKGFILTHTEKRVVGGSLEGRLGAGRAKLTVSLSAGDLDIEAIDGINQ
jgi:Putative adhesin